MNEIKDLNRLMKEIATVSSIGGGPGVTRFHTPAGKIDIVPAQDFIKGIPRTIVDGYGSHVAIPKITNKHISSETVMLNRTINIARHAMLTANHVADVFYNQMNALIYQELFPIIAKKNVDFHQKDLSIKSIEDLSMKYLEQGGNSGSLYGVLFNLSKYQKFFLLASLEDFNAYFTEASHNMSSDSLCIRGALANLRPELLFIGRYEESIYLNEMSKQVRYVVPKGFDIGEMNNTPGGLIYVPSKHGLITNLTHDY